MKAAVVMVKVLLDTVMPVTVAAVETVIVVLLEVVLVTLLLIKVVVVVSVAVVRNLACAGTVIGIFAKVFTADMGVDVLIVVPNMLAGVIVNAFAVVMTTFELATPAKI